ncbi:helicase-related protein [bacterium]|nr:helicase-related protein [bacterium]
MPKRTSQAGSELFIVDNSHDDWKVSSYLYDWSAESESFDIATAFFEIGALLELDDEWQKVDKIRILMGDEVSARTKRAFEKALEKIASSLDVSLESEKVKNDFLVGVPAIVEAIKSGKIECRVYRKDRFHAKCYLTHARKEIIGSFGLVGSSNLTVPGITKNVELNVQIKGAEVEVLKEWFDQHWNDAEDVSLDILRVIQRHTDKYSPFDVYAKSLHEFFKSHEMTAGDWERNESVIYPILSQYQKDGYHGMLKRAQRYNGAFLCDGVGLGKTFVGLMLIERLIFHDNLNVALFVPKSGLEAVWKSTLKRYIPELFGSCFNNLAIFSHTDFFKESAKPDLTRAAKMADVVIIDEAHHFRNTGTTGEYGDKPRSRYWRMHDLIGEKTTYLLTATPINNRLLDFQHMAELFTRNRADHFKAAPLGIHSFPGHIRKLEKKILKSMRTTGEEKEQLELDLSEADEFLEQDLLFKNLVVQRSRSYVIESMKDEGDVQFPEPRRPKVQPYSVKQTYGKLLGMFEEAFKKENPLFTLGIYFPYAYYLGDDDSIDAFSQGRQEQVVSLIRTSFLKRFESSIEAFRQSCWALLTKLLAWVEVHSESEKQKNRLEKWKIRNKKLIDYVPEYQRELFDEDSEEAAEEDLVTPELLETVDRLDPGDFDIAEILADTFDDLDQLVEFLRELEKFRPSQDKKLTELIKLLRNDSVLSQHKVIIFSEFAATARYLYEQLVDAKIQGVAQIDGQTSTKGRLNMIRRFAPYYNHSSSEGLAQSNLDEVRVLISTDVLSEGLNLQDATRLINYDLHWNPVRLMQRIGRVDRRMNRAIETQIIADHPDQKKLRGTVGYWNFLPPEELNKLLSLYSTVTRKTLIISKTLGIEGGKLLTEDDELQDLKNFTEKYYGKMSPTEMMRQELNQLFKEDPNLEERLNILPNKIFSGKENISPGTHAVFLCYARPGEDAEKSNDAGEPVWTNEAGDVAWYLYDIESKRIFEEPGEIVDHVRSTKKTPRKCVIEQPSLQKIRETMEKHLTKTYLRTVQAPPGVKPTLRAWMELN